MHFSNEAVLWAARPRIRIQLSGAFGPFERVFYMLGLGLDREQSKCNQVILLYYRGLLIRTCAAQVLAYFYG